MMGSLDRKVGFFWVAVSLNMDIPDYCGECY